MLPAVIILAASTAFAREPLRLRVITYNIHSAKGLDRRVLPERIAAVISGFHPDVVALQEIRVGRVEARTIETRGQQGAPTVPPPVGAEPLPPPEVVAPRAPSNTPPTGVPFTDQPRIIAEAAGMYHVFYPLVRLKAEDYGIAVLSRYPMKVIRAQNLPTRGGRRPTERRGVIWVELAVDGRRVQLINTHLGLNPEERSRQIETILGPDFLADRRATPPLVLCGDLNSGVSGEPYGRLSTVALDAASVLNAGRNTFPSYLPLMRLDHIFVSKDLVVDRFEVPNSLRIRLASDHLPVLVDLTLP